MNKILASMPLVKNGVDIIMIPYDCCVYLLSDATEPQRSFWSNFCQMSLNCRHQWIILARVVVCLVLAFAGFAQMPWCISQIRIAFLKTACQTPYHLIIGAHHNSKCFCTPCKRIFSFSLHFQLVMLVKTRSFILPLQLRI